jgi:hypothetical protein
MGIFTSPRRSPYVPQSSSDATDSRATLLGRLPNSRPVSEPKVVRVSGGKPDDISQESPARPFRGVAPNTEPPPGSPEFEDAMTKAVGHPVILPNGSPIADPNSDSGYLMSPVADLAPVAAAGRRARQQVQEMLANPETAAGATPYFYAAAGMSVGQGGLFDYQREGNHLTGFLQYPHFRNVSNLNVGLFAHQAGMSLEQALAISGLYSRVFGRTDPSQPNSLNARTAEFIRKGFEAGASGIFDPPGLP